MCADTTNGTPANEPAKVSGVGLSSLPAGASDLVDLDTVYAAMLKKLQGSIRQLQELHYRYGSDEERTPTKLQALQRAAHVISVQVTYRRAELMVAMMSEQVPADGGDRIGGIDGGRAGCPRSSEVVG